MLTQRAFDRLLDRWILEGRVAPDQRAALLADARAAGRIAHPATVIAVFAAVLVGLAALAFVAANWQAMPRALRLGLLVVALLGAHGGAIALFRVGLAASFGHAMLLLGAGLFGVAMALVSQMYHLGGDLSRLLLVWGLGAAATALAGRSRPPLWLAGGLFVWMGLEGGPQDTYVALALTAALALPLWRWRLAGEWALLTLGLAVLAYSLLDWDDLGLAPVLAAHLLAWGGAAWADDGTRPWPGPVRATNLILALGIGVLVPLIGEDLGLYATDAAAATAAMAAGAAGLAWRALLADRLKLPEAVALTLLAVLAITHVALSDLMVTVFWIGPGLILAVAVLLAVQSASAGEKGRMAVAVIVFLAEAVAVYMGRETGLMAAAGFFLIGGVALGAASVLAARQRGEGAS